MRTATSAPIASPTAFALVAELRDAARYDAIAARETSQTGHWFYAVRTTGVYCKPSCGARLPKRENVSFHESIAAAEQAGFRPCKRCRPDRQDADLHSDVVTATCRMIDASLAAEGAAPSLAALATRTGFSSFHLHRVFRKATGLTPRGYAAAVRARMLEAALPQRRTVSESMHAAGYSSSSRFYEQSARRLGMLPVRARRGGTGETVRFAVAHTSLGALLVATTVRGICSVQLGDNAGALVAALKQRFHAATLIADDPGVAVTMAAVVATAESQRDVFALPLDIRGTAFQERVWRALTATGSGRHISYADLAAAIGAPCVVRAVASARAANEITTAVPCHRVIRSDGTVSGFRWGFERKEALLEREATS